MIAGQLPIAVAPLSELERLEQVIVRAQEAKQKGDLKLDRYKEFLVQFRASLDQAWSVSSHAPAESSSYARIQARLGDTAQAVAALGPAIKRDPQNADLRLTLGEVNFENKNYPAALAEADAILMREPGNKRAQALKQFSTGRISGAAAVGPSPLQSGAAGGTPLMGDTRVLAASRRAAARMNAIHFADEAMSRLKINDPREALRYATLAEASDPTLPDASMQQGLAYMGLKELGKAVDRFGRAEELWRAQGDRQADIAHGMKEHVAGKMLARPQAAETQPVLALDPRRKTWPLGGAGAGLLLSGVIAVLLKKDEIERWRKPLMSGALSVSALSAADLRGMPSMPWPLRL